MPSPRQGESSEGLGERVRRLRQQLNWTQERLADEARVSKSFISEVESGDSQPRGPVLVRIATALGASLDYLLTGQERPAPAPPQAIEVPKELAEMAKKWGMPYPLVEALMQFHSQIEAMRRDQAVRRMSGRDWEDLYERVRPYLKKLLRGAGK